MVLGTLIFLTSMWLVWWVILDRRYVIIVAENNPFQCDKCITSGNQQDVELQSLQPKSYPPHDEL